MRGAAPQRAACVRLTGGGGRVDAGVVAMPTLIKLAGLLKGSQRDIMDEEEMPVWRRAR